jgi:hypothetical protein
MNNASPLAFASNQANSSSLVEGGGARVLTARETRLIELRTCLSHISTTSTSSFIGKVAYLARDLGVSQEATKSLLKDYFTELGYEDLRPLRISYFVKGCYRWSKDREGVI